MSDLSYLLSFLLKLTRELRFSRLMVGITAFAGSLAGLLQIAMIALVSAILGHQAGPRAAAWAFAGCCLALPLFRYLSQSLLVHLSQRGLLGLRLQLTRRILAAPLRQLEALGAPKLSATLTQDVSAIVESLSTVPTLFMHLATVLGCLGYLGWLSWKVLLEVLVALAFGLLTYQLPVNRAMRHFRAARKTYDQVAGQIRGLTEGTKELKMHGDRRDGFLAAVGQSTSDLQRHERSGALIFAAALSWGQVLFYAVVGLLVFVFPRFQNIGQGTLFAFTLVLFQLMIPLEVLLTLLPNLSRGAAAARQIEELGLSLVPEAPAAAPGALLPSRAGDWGSLELAGVTHSYATDSSDRRFVLGPLDLTFHPGELVFVVGGNGSGKTTFAKLLLGLYAPESGEIRFAGRRVGEGDRERYRESFSAVFSDFFLFDTLFGPDAERLDGEAQIYLRRLRLDSKVSVRDGRYSTVDLSQGQRKRLALLTTFLEDRPIYLFDEWAADQDPSFKEIFYLEILPELKARGKTVFVITHDDRYFHLADRLLKLDYGRLELDREGGALPWDVPGADVAAPELQVARR